MIEGQKRVKNNDFQEVAKCLSCKSLFWADSEYELGNWQRICNKCGKIDEKQEQVRIDKVKKEGKPFKGLYGIIGWKLGKEEVINYQYPFPKEFSDISQIDDLVRKIKRENLKKITIIWNPILYEMLLDFILFQGYGNFLGKKKIRYMGITHKKSLKVERYILK